MREQLSHCGKTHFNELKQRSNLPVDKAPTINCNIRRRWAKSSHFIELLSLARSGHVSIQRMPYRTAPLALLCPWSEEWGLMELLIRGLRKTKCKSVNQILSGSRTCIARPGLSQHSFICCSAGCFCLRQPKRGCSFFVFVNPPVDLSSSKAENELFRPKQLSVRSTDCGCCWCF